MGRVWSSRRLPVAASAADAARMDDQPDRADEGESVLVTRVRRAMVARLSTWSGAALTLALLAVAAGVVGLAVFARSNWLRAAALAWVLFP